MKKLFSMLSLFAALLLMGGCESNQTPSDETPVPYGEGVYVLCEGSYGAGNASLWFYDRDTKEVKADVFGQANDAKLGDVGQSMLLHNGDLLVVVNNSGVVYSLDAATGVVKGMIENLLSPRFVAIAPSGTKGYISQMYTNKVVVFDPRTMTVTGELELEGVADSEQMVIWGGKLFVAAWSNGHKIVVVDTETDTQVDLFEVGVQPYSMVLDKDGYIWVVCDGGNEWSYLPEGVTMEAPSLWKISAETHEATKLHTFTPGGYFRSRLAIDGQGDTLYFIYDAVWAVDVASGVFPSEPLIAVEGWGQYGLDVDPFNGDIYIADAKDYVSNGAVLRYNDKGEKVDEFEVGLLPSKFVFR
jgi:DNA-binding beta-propeller fold protein YncE